MRIFDVLLRNLIDDVIDKDDSAKLNKEKGDYLVSLVESIRKCGVSFSTWSSKVRGDLDWTSLTGNEMKKVVKELPDRMMFVIHNNTHDDVHQLWKSFWKLYKLICSEEVERQSAEQIFSQAKQWVELFLKLDSTERKSYSRANVTPYMHCLVYHVTYFISKYGSLSKFSGQPTEKINDNIKSVHHLKTNHHDSAVDAMKVQKRIETTTHLSRNKRNYKKADEDFWDFKKRQMHVQKQRQILKEIENANASNVFNATTTSESPLDYSSMTDGEIKEKMKELGVITRIRKREKLIELLKSHVK